MSLEQDLPDNIPAYELTAQCYLPWQNDETGQVGPTLLEIGQVIYTDATPSEAWKPLNALAEKKLEAMRAALPIDGKDLKLEDITEAAYMLRPREGDEIDHREWSKQVAALAVNLGEKRRGLRGPAGPVRTPGRRGDAPVMPFASTSVGLPMDPAIGAGRVFTPPQQNVARQPGKRKPAMANAPDSDALSQTSGR